MTPKERLTKVVSEAIASQLLFGNTNGKADILARHVVDKLCESPTDSKIGGWLIYQGDQVKRVAEVDFRDTDYTHDTFEVYTVAEPHPDETE